MNKIEVPCWRDLKYTFDPAHTALLVIDMQKDFLDPNGMCNQLDEDIYSLRAIMPLVSKLVTTLRDNKLRIIHTREGYSADLSDVHPLKRERNSVGKQGPLGRFLIRGESGHDFMTGFEPKEGETVIDKPGFSAFYATDLEIKLRELNITHLIITGITTQCCVLSTIRSAVDRGFYCLTIADACAAEVPADHDAAIATILAENSLFGWVTDSDDILRVLID